MWTGEKKERAKAEILERLTNGEFISSICSDEHLPAHTELGRWITQDASFGNAYVRAKELGVDVRVERKLEASEQQRDPQRGRLMADNVKWWAGKVRPHVYGDRVALDITQSIDLQSAMSQAQTRLARPDSDQYRPPALQTIDPPAQYLPASTDSQSDEAPPGDDPLDIFS